MKVVEIKQWNIFSVKGHWKTKQNIFFSLCCFILGGHKWVLLSLSIQAIVWEINLILRKLSTNVRKMGRKLRKMDSVYFLCPKKIRPWQFDVICSVCPSFNYKSHSMFLTVYVRLPALFLLSWTYNFRRKLFVLEVLEAGCCDGTVPLCRQVWAAMFFL